jgi:Flp pilus assembly protein TadG
MSIKLIYVKEKEMNSKHLNSEKGQAIVYLVIGLVVFLGFVAMAIDGGMVLADRRDAQNATDASALAGASAAAQIVKNQIIDPKNFDSACTYGLLYNAKTAAIEAAKERATSNGYSLTDTGNYVQVTCGNAASPYMDVSVQISKTTPTSFLQVLVPSATLTNKMSAISRLNAAMEWGGGNAIVALNNSDKCSMEIGAGFSGNTLANVNGGGIFSNGCLTGGGSADVNVTGGNISYWYTKDKSDDLLKVFDPAPATVSDRLSAPIVGLKPSDCDLAGAHKVASLPSSMTAGLWCVTDSKGVKITNGSYTGDGVTIYILNGDLKVTGGSINLKAPVNNATNHAINGLLFYVPNGLVDLTGNNDSYYQGSILAPTSDITVNGNGTSDCFHSQLIGYNVKLNGTSLFTITYDPSQNLSIPATIDLYK